MRILGLILARSQSKGLPDKNIKLLNGKPLMSYAIRAALHSLLDDIYVSSDSQRYLDLAQSYGAKTILRPEELAQDDSPSIEAVKHALGHIDTDVICLINCCAPLIQTQDIDNMIAVMEKTRCDSVVSVVEDFTCHPSKICQLDGDRIIVGQEFRTWERQNIVGCYKRNAALYLAKREVIERGGFFGKNTRAYIMPKSRSIDINDEQDFFLAECLIKWNENKTTS